MKKKGFVLLFLLLSPFPIFGSIPVFRFTGNPATRDFIRRELQNIYQNLYGPETQVFVPNIKPLFPYEKRTIKISITAPQRTVSNFPVVVSNEKAPLLPGTFLLFSDHPEVIHENGLLFSAGIIQMRPVRLNYYHQNQPGDPPRAVSVRVWNTDKTPSLLYVIASGEGPSQEIMETGHEATVHFLKNYEKKLGMLFTLPSHGEITLSRQILQGGDLATGFLQIVELKGRPLQLTVTAEDPAAPLEAENLLESSDTHARGAYEIPRLRFFARYAAGDKETVIPLGDIPLRNLIPGEPLKGTYGMFWEGTIQLENPFASSAKIPIFLQPRGGPVTATFFLDGDLRKIQYLPAYRTIPLSVYTLPPKSRKTLHIMSMPEGGSSYPIKLIIGKPSL